MATHQHYSPCLTPEAPKHHHHTPIKHHTPFTAELAHSAHNYQEESPYRQHEKKQSSKHFVAPFVSVYGRETRLEQVMRLKTRPATASKGGVEALLALEEKSQVILQEEPTRLQKIMALKVPKPNVVSTLANYQPRVVPRQQKEKQNHPPEEKLWQCQQQCKREAQAEQRAERQWRQEERQRELQLQRRRKEAEREQTNRRRKQTQFQNLVQKEVRKIERQRDLSQRKNGGFAIYIYPEC